MMNQGFCLVLAIWGNTYPDASVNTLVDAAKKNSPQLREVVLLTDRHRPAIDESVRQNLFPEFFSKPKFFKGGYRVKIAVFSSNVLPSETVCVYLDLDTLVTGDIGKIAGLVKNHSDIFMLPPGSLISFGFIRRFLSRLTHGKRFATGNSSVMAFHSSAKPSISDMFQEKYTSEDVGPYMEVDDVFISWAGQSTVKEIPRSLAVSFRREFLSRSGLVLWWRRVSPIRQIHRNSIVAITFNGTQYKPAELLKLKVGDRISDAKGRFGFWSDKHMGVLRLRIIDYCQRIVKNNFEK